MQGYNVIAVYDMTAEKLLMCRRKKEPYMGMSNLVGGKIEKDEDGLAAAYRELWEETAITGDDIELHHLMDFKWYMSDCYMEVYVGKLNKPVDVSGDENDLYWTALDQNFFDMTKYAGEGNIGHILAQVELYNKDLLK